MIQDQYKSSVIKQRTGHKLSARLYMEEAYLFFILVQ